MTRNQDRVVDRAPKGFWGRLRTYDKILAGQGQEYEYVSPLSGQEPLSGLSKTYAYKMRPPLIHFPALLGGPHLSMSSAIHDNVRDSRAWDNETKAAAFTTVAESEASPGSGLLTPSPEDYDLVLYYMELGVEAEDRRPLSPLE